MTDNDMLKNIDYLREKADVTYEEAADLLEKHNGNVMRVLVELEQQGRVYPQSHTGYAQDTGRRQQSEFNEAKEKAASFVDKAFQNRLVVERTREDGSKETVVNVSAPVAAGAALVAPWLAVAGAAIGYATGHSVKIEKEKDVEKEEKGDKDA